MMNGLEFGRDTMGDLGQDLALGATHSTQSTKSVGRYVLNPALTLQTLVRHCHIIWDVYHQDQGFFMLLGPFVGQSLTACANFGGHKGYRHR